MMSRESFLSFAVPDVGEEELREIEEVLRSGWVTTGPKTKEFESQFALAVGAKHAVALNSCTAALHLALEAIGVKKGDEIITTPYTFAATAEVIRYFDARPVFVDVCPDDMNLDPVAVNRAVSARTKAIIPVHIAGLPADMDAILDIGHKRGLPVIEDAAHAFPSVYKGKTVGSIGDITCFSFYATKTLTTGEGGMVCTDNSEWADRCRIMSLHGISRDAWKRYSVDGSWYYEVIAPGYKYNLTDVASAMGLAQLRKTAVMHEKRRAIARAYNEAFSKMPELTIPHDRSDCQHAWHLYLLRLQLERLSIDRSAFIEQLKERSIGVSVHFIPLHLHPYYRDLYGYTPQDFPVATREYTRVISLPIYSRMTDEDVTDVISAVSEIIEGHRR